MKQIDWIEELEKKNKQSKHWRDERGRLRFGDTDSKGWTKVYYTYETSGAATPGYKVYYDTTA